MIQSEALEAVDSRMRMAKKRFSLAALACLRQAHDAAEQVAKALAELEAAREALRAFQAQQPPEAHPEAQRASWAAESAEAGE